MEAHATFIQHQLSIKNDSEKIFKLGIDQLMIFGSEKLKRYHYYGPRVLIKRYNELKSDEERINFLRNPFLFIEGDFANIVAREMNEKNNG